MPARKRRKWDTDGASSSVPEFSLRVRKCAAQIRTWLANVDGALKIRDSLARLQQPFGREGWQSRSAFARPNCSSVVG